MPVNFGSTKLVALSMLLHVPEKHRVAPTTYGVPDKCHSSNIYFQFRVYLEYARLESLQRFCSIMSNVDDIDSEKHRLSLPRERLMPL